MKLLLAVFLAGLVVAGPAVYGVAQTEADPVENSNPMEIVLFRQVPPQFTGGAQMEVVVTISAAIPGAITAMGLYEQVPPEWTFTGMRGMTGDPPPVSPEPGSMSPLQFAWITPPPLPYTFAYTLAIPQNDAGMKSISGQVEYRTTGPRLVSPPAITEINGADKTPPSITLLGPSPMTVELGAAYQEPGYTASDNVDGDITSRVKVMGTVDTSRAGQYTLSYSVADSAGNQSETIMRTVIVRSQQNNTNTNTNRPARYNTYGGPYYGGAGARQNPAAKNAQNATAQQQNTSPKGQAPSNQPNAAEMDFPTQSSGTPADGPMSKFNVPKLPGVKEDGKPAAPADAPVHEAAAKRPGKLEDMDGAPVATANNTDPVAAAPVSTPANPGAAAPTAPPEIVGATPESPSTDTPGPAASSAPPHVGLLTRVYNAFAIMTPAQRLGFAASGVVAALLALLSLFAWKAAYGGRVRRPRKSSVPAAGVE